MSSTKTARGPAGGSSIGFRGMRRIQAGALLKAKPALGALTREDLTLKHSTARHADGARSIVKSYWRTELKKIVRTSSIISKASGFEFAL